MNRLIILIFTFLSLVLTNTNLHGQDITFEEVKEDSFNIISSAVISAAVPYVTKEMTKPKGASKLFTSVKEDGIIKIYETNLNAKAPLRKLRFTQVPNSKYKAVTKLGKECFQFPATFTNTKKYKMTICEDFMIEARRRHETMFFWMTDDPLILNKE